MLLKSQVGYTLLGLAEDGMPSDPFDITARAPRKVQSSGGRVGGRLVISEFGREVFGSIPKVENAS